MNSLDFFRENHPYIVARALFLGGQIPTVQAIGMVAADRDVIAEAELTGRDRLEAARHIVLNSWLPLLVKHGGKVEDGVDLLKC